MLPPRSSDSHSGDYEEFCLLGYKAWCPLLVGFLPGLLFGLEDGGDMFLLNVGLRRTIWRYIPEEKTRNSASACVLFQLILLMT
jgi:hypothetical protein